MMGPFSDMERRSSNAVQSCGDHESTTRKARASLDQARNELHELEEEFAGGFQPEHSQEVVERLRNLQRMLNSVTELCEAAATPPTYIVTSSAPRLEKELSNSFAVQTGLDITDPDIARWLKSTTGTDISSAFA
eukprot:jgi/Mesvir1/14755/Mv05397-RA.1